MCSSGLGDPSVLPRALIIEMQYTQVIHQGLPHDGRCKWKRWLWADFLLQNTVRPHWENVWNSAWFSHSLHCNTCENRLYSHSCGLYLQIESNNLLAWVEIQKLKKRLGPAVCWYYFLQWFVYLSFLSFIAGPAEVGELVWAGLDRLWVIYVGVIRAVRCNHKFCVKVRG